MHFLVLRQYSWLFSIALFVVVINSCSRIPIVSSFSYFPTTITTTNPARTQNKHNKKVYIHNFWHSALRHDVSSLTMSNNGHSETMDLLSRISFRRVTVEDLDVCAPIEEDSYPPDEAATPEILRYRQTEAGNYFECAILDSNKIIGFVCGTRCTNFEEESMATHLPTGPLLAIHSVVVQKEYRRKGVATAMLQAYLKKMQEENTDGSIQSFVLIAKANLLGFYVNCGFRVLRPSPVVHGKDLWYDLEKPTMAATLPKEEESWFCKTEQFKRSFPEVKPHLEQHKAWVQSLRNVGVCITSGYRVDAQGKPGGGGLMFLAAKSYDDALQLVKRDPLVANDCVDWELNGWIGQVGDLELR